MGIGWLKYGAVAAVIIGLPLAGYVKGRADGKAKVEEKQRIAIEKLEADLSIVAARSREQAAQLMKSEENANALANQLEDTALQDPDANKPALPSSSVRRIFSR